MRKNDEIVAHQVRVVTDGGNSVMTTKDAQSLATSQNLDLVQIQDGEIPVCKILSWDKFRYEQTLAKKERDKANRQATVKIKEIQLRPGIAEADLEVKANHIKEFISKGDRVQLIMVMRGREVTHSGGAFDVINDMIDRVKSNLGDKLKIISAPRNVGRKIIAELGSSK